MNAGSLMNGGRAGRCPAFTRARAHKFSFSARFKKNWRNFLQVCDRWCRSLDSRWSYICRVTFATVSWECVDVGD